MKMKKTIIIIMCILISILLFVVGPILGIYLFLYYPKIKQINIKEDIIELYKGDIYSIDYKIFPENAKNVNIISNSDPKYVTVLGKEITAVESGTTKVCYMQKNDKKVKDCITVNIKSKREKLIEELDRTCKKLDDQVYNCFPSLNTILNLNDYTYILKDEGDSSKSEYTYHFDQNYIDGYADLGDCSVEYFYRTDTRTLSCLGSPQMFHNVACTYTSQQTTINLFDMMVKSVDSILDDLTVEDLKD